MMSPGLVSDGTKCSNGHVSRFFAQLLMFYRYFDSLLYLHVFPHIALF